MCWISTEQPMINCDKHCIVIINSDRLYHKVKLFKSNEYYRNYVPVMNGIPEFIIIPGFKVGEQKADNDYKQIHGNPHRPGFYSIVIDYMDNRKDNVGSDYQRGRKL